MLLLVRQAMIVHIYTYVVNQQMHTGKICFNIYYESSTCFERLCEHHQGAITGILIKYKRTANAQVQSPNVTVIISGAPCGC
jgi:hypothetical protein